MIRNEAIDPFAHLHDEAYADAFAGKRASHETLMTDAGRPRLDLGGEWRMTLDLFDEGLRQKWHELPADEPAQWDKPRDYDIDAGALVPVPSCWNLLRPEWLHFEGAAWLTREFEAPSLSRDERAVLRIGAANYAAFVFVNGAHAGGHIGGSTPFCLDVTDLLHPGANRLQFCVENRRRPDRVPMHHFDWFNYGGVYREVCLLIVPAIHIRQASAALAPGSGGARIDVRIALSASFDGEASVAIPELGVLAGIAIKDGKGEACIAASPELWSPERPRLYEVNFQFGEDVVAERIGFRDISVRGTEILLNGAPIYLKGVCVHEDDLALGKVSTEADVRRRLEHARELGCNFLRLAHYPHHEHVARLADELGFLLWAEIPVYWAIDFANPATLADARNQMLELIARDINRASVILWGVGNENADTNARFEFMAALARAARAADPTRLIAAACLINRETFAIEDRLAAELDVIGVNEYFGWYEPDFSGLERLLANSRPDKPVVISETGADALAGRRGAGRALFSEDWQAEFFRRQFAILRNAPYVRGVALWLMYDFRSERRQTRFQHGFNRKGLIAEDKQNRKLAFDVVRQIYHDWPNDKI